MADNTSTEEHKHLGLWNIVILISGGILFGLGLSVSEMVNPARVLGFLNVLGPWDPTLAFVMLGALSVAVPGFQFAKLLHKPFLAIKFSLPSIKDLDRPLITGALVFGIGWGLAGICPGPSLVALNSLQIEIPLFVLSMLAGIVIHDRFFSG